jgi:NADPH-dependent 2,4-dienoyl-CoA reductase/sulfur reductase-like enzyme
VVGGGLIGIEAAEICVAAGLAPHFFIREEWFWPMAIDRREAGWITDRMSEHGVQVHLEHNLERIEGEQDEGVQRVVTDQGSYDSDLLAVTIGVIPNTGWLEESGLTLEESSRGVLVDDRLSASAPDVFAAGDCAAVPWFNGVHRPEPLWYTARAQGRVAGRRLLGLDARYDRGIWYNSAKLMDIEYTTAGFVNLDLAGEQEWFFEERGPVRSTNRIVVKDGAVVGFNFLGRRWDQSVLIEWIRDQRDLEWVVDHLDEACFDTEFVPPLRIPPKSARELSRPKEGSGPFRDATLPI